MPKIIKNLKKKIINCSTELFKENLYQDVCMKNIADKLDIAVGTIYNYFPTKWDLYIEIFEESLEKIYNKLYYKTNNVKEDHIKIFFTIMYQEMFKTKLMVQKLFNYINENNNSHQDRKKAIDKIIFNKIIFTKIYDLFLINLKYEYKEICIESYQEELKKLFVIIQTSIPTLFKTYPQYEQANIQFIIDLIQSYIKGNIKNST